MQHGAGEISEQPLAEALDWLERVLKNAMSTKSIIDLVGRAEAFRLMGEAIADAARKNKEAGVATASHINGMTVITKGKKPSKTTTTRK